VAAAAASNKRFIEPEIQKPEPVIAGSGFFLERFNVWCH